jgi:hypothetical protein
MSIRSTPRTAASHAAATPQAPIDFKDEFVNSAAALAASHDETVSHILSRLDQLQAKIATQPEANTNSQPAPSSNPAPRAAARSINADQSVHARLASLESIHEDALHRLSSKLDLVERQLIMNKEQLSANKESEGLMTQIAARLQQVEPRLQSHADMCDRMASLESRMRSHADLHDRVSTLEANARPDPEQERILARINAKLDILEERQSEGKKRAALGAQHEPSRNTLDADMASMQERREYLQDRISRLKELRGRYEAAT